MTVTMRVTMRDKTTVKIKLPSELRTFDMVAAVRAHLDPIYGSEWQVTEFTFYERRVSYTYSDLTILNDDKGTWMEVGKGISQATVPILLVTIRDKNNAVLFNNY